MALKKIEQPYRFDPSYTLSIGAKGDFLLSKAMYDLVKDIDGLSVEFYRDDEMKQWYLSFVSNRGIPVKVNRLRSIFIFNSVFMRKEILKDLALNDRQEVHVYNGKRIKFMIGKKTDFETVVCWPIITNSIQIATRS